MRKIVFLIVFISAFQTNAQEISEIKWDDLVPKGLDFQDPFLELSDGQLYNLRYIYKTKLLIKSRPEAVSAKTLAKVDSLEQVLREDGVDIDYLISQREKIRDKRKKKAQSVVQELDGKHIRMAGFLLPLEASRRVVTEFLFVPYVGACIHQPAPPKNQIIYFEYPAGYKVNSRYDATWIEGEIIIKETTSKLQLVDGVDKIEAGYSIRVSKMEPYYEK